MLLQAALNPPTDPRFYMSRTDALLHGARKSAISAIAYGGLRKIGLGRTLAGVLSTVGPWAIGAAIEAGKGHQQDPMDKLGDLGWHSAGVLPLATRKAWTALLPLATIGLTRKKASPGW